MVRETLAALLTREGGMRVTVASDPIVAVERIRASRPDVILLDLEMPRMDGLTFLRQLMATDPIPVVVCSGLAHSGSDAAIRALQDGAVDVIPKALLGVRGALESNAATLVGAVRAAAGARVVRRTAAAGATRVRKGDGERPLAVTTNRVVVMGASTGGVAALALVLGALPVDAPGVVVVQHMPREFTAALARQLDAACRVDVVQARHGDRVLAGRVLVAPGDSHLRLRRDGAHYAVEVLDGPRVNGHRPSVDVLFHAAAAAGGVNAMGVLLTGMGADGAAGLLALRRVGALTVAQDEATSVVFGMPAEAIKLGGAQRVMPLARIGGAVAQFGSGG